MSVSLFFTSYGEGVDTPKAHLSRLWYSDKPSLRSTKKHLRQPASWHHHHRNTVRLRGGWCLTIKLHLNLIRDIYIYIFWITNVLNWRFGKSLYQIYEAEVKGTWLQYIRYILTCQDVPTHPVTSQRCCMKTSGPGAHLEFQSTNPNQQLS